MNPRPPDPPSPRLEEGLTALDRELQRAGFPRAGQRRRLLAELRDAVEAELVDLPPGAPQPDFAALARTVARTEAALVQQRAVSSACAALGPATLTLGFMLAAGRAWGHAVAFGAGYGLSVAFALFWFRARWLGTRGPLRHLAPLAVGFLAAVPWAFMLNRRFDPPMLFYGAASGYLLERFFASRGWRVWVPDNLLLTGLAFLLAGLGSGWNPAKVNLRYVPWAIGYHLCLQAGMALGVLAHRRMGAWFLERPLEG